MSESNSIFIKGARINNLKNIDVEIPRDKLVVIAAYEPSNHRSQLKQTGNNELIIDAYNANPSSMKAAGERFTT